MVIDAILRQAHETPERDALRILGGGEAVTESLTYAALADRALARAGWLAARGLVGRPVALVMDTGAAFVEALLGCLAAGAIAAPLPLPRQALAAERLRSALSDLGPAAILCDEAASLPPGVSDAPVLGMEPTGLGDAGPLPRPDPDAPAVIQYSSGSTAEPRGIVLTAANIAANLEMMRLTMEGEPGDLAVNWLPLTHDMGLFGGLLAPLWHASTAVLMPPAAFLRRPIRWLRAIHAHRATHATAPNFGYALAVRRADPAALAALDLSCWRVACIGAEPTLPETLDAFLAATAPAGFRPAVFRSCYGLAEATLLCSSGPTHRIGARIACGTAPPGCTLRLRPVPEVTEPGAGELMVAGPHVSPGFWDPAALGRVRPYPGTETDAEGRVFVPTGDIASFAAGNLLIHDRLKDILPLHGGALGPTEVEQAACALDPRIEAAAAVPAALPGSSVVRLAVEAQERRLPPEQRAELATRLRAELAARFGIETRVWFFAPWALPRTTSGKIRRFAVRALLVEAPPGAGDA